MKIITDYVYSPIPYRHNDWVAFYESEEEEGLRGWGKTEEESINDLKSQDK